MSDSNAAFELHDVFTSTSSPPSITSPPPIASPPSISSPPSSSSPSAVSSPPILHPSASPQEARNFLTDCLRYYGYWHNNVEEKISRVCGNGEQLYRWSVEQWKNVLGDDLGPSIFDLLQRSCYGYNGSYWPLIQTVERLVLLVGCVWKLSELYLLGTVLPSAVPFTCLNITGIIAILNVLCRNEAIVNWKKILERLKIRNPAARPYVWEFWKILRHTSSIS